MSWVRLLAASLVLAGTLPAAHAAGGGWASYIGSSLGEARDLALRMKATGEVTAVDTDARLMAVHAPAGTIVFRLDPKVANADQIRIGQRVLVDFVAGFLLTVRRGMEWHPQATEPPPVVQPLEDSYERPLTFMSHVVGVDKDNLLLRLKAPGGQTSDYPVYDRTALVGVRTGDAVRVSMHQAVAVDVTVLAR